MVPVTLNEIALTPGVALACAMASRKLPGPLSLVLLTM